MVYGSCSEGVYKPLIIYIYTYIHTYFHPSTFLQVLYFLREASQHGTQEGHLLVLTLQLLLKLVDVVVGAAEETLQALKLALLQVLRQLLSGPFKCAAAMGGEERNQ